MLSYGIYTVALLFLAGQSQECENDAVGLGDGRIPDAQLSSSSSTATAKDGRLGNHASWCAADGDLNPYLQIYLGTNYVICAIATQGDATRNRWVETYQLQSSTDGTSWTNYTMNGSNKVINGNSNPGYVMKRILLSSIFGRYVRLIPREFYGGRCLRVELYGSLVVEEDEAVGVKNQAAFPDWRFSSPSEYDSRYSAHKARLNGPLGWTPKAAHRGSAYLQIDLGTVYNIYAIATQGNGGSSGNDGIAEYAKSYKLQLSLDNTTWTFYKEGSTSQIFKGNEDQSSIVKNVLPSTVSAVAIRIVPVDYESYPTLRVELYHIPFPKVDRSKALGISNVAAFPNSRFSSPSVFSNSYLASKARLNGVYGWAPKSGDKDTAYLQIELGTVYNIYAIATQGNGGPRGNNGAAEWAKTYKLQFSLDNSNWNYYVEGSTQKIFQGNTDQSTAVTNILRKQTKARVVRVRPQTYNNFPTLRVELYQPPYRPKVYSGIAVGLVNRSTVTDHRYSASSFQSDKMPYLARLHGVKGWAPEIIDRDSAYLEIDLGAAYIVCAIATQGYSGSDNYWVTQYQLKLSMDGEDWSFDRTLQGNYDKTSVVKNFVNPPTQAKFIHVKPKAYNTHPALRIEVYGSIREIFSPFGLENNTVPDIHLNASSSRDANHTAKEGRLYNSNAWCAEGNGTDEYFQIDLGSIVTITGLATQGEPRGTSWVKTYNVRYSNKGKEWRTVQTVLSANVFKGNGNNTKVFANWFSGSLAAQFLKIAPQTYEKAICLRAEIYGSTFVLPQIIKPPSNRTVISGSNVTFSCVAYGAPKPRITWKFSGGVLPPHRYQGDNLAVLFVNNNVSFEGAYICIASNDAGETRATAWLTIDVPPTVTSAFSNLTLLMNETFNLTCEVIGDPAPSVIWVKDDSTKSRNRVLTIAKVDLDDIGRYQCIASNRAGNSTSSVWLDVQVIPEIVTAPSNKTVISGSNVTFSCAAYGVPEPRITWKFSGGVLPPHRYHGDNLTVLSVNNGDSFEGAYTCNASNDAGETQATAWLTVDVPPTVTSAFSNLTLLMNESFSLTCEVIGDPAPSVEWVKDGSKKSSNRVLTIEKLDLGDIGRYQCIARNRAGNSTASVWLDVQAHAAVRISPPLTRIYVKQQQNISIDCYGNGNPVPSVMWIRNNSLVNVVRLFSGEDAASVVQVITGTSSPLHNVTARLFLRTAGVTYSDAGKYTCVANNTIKGNVSLSTQNLEILFEPQFMEQPPNVTVLSGNNASFSCKATGYPKPTIEWSFNGAELPQHKVSDDGTLTVLFANNSVQYEGGYNCTASSRAGSNSATAWLTVDVPPKILSTTANQTLLITEELKLKCVATGEPRPVVFWMKDGLQKSSSSVLTIENVDFHDSGRYQCVANSSAGTATASVWVDILVHARVYVSQPFTRGLIRHQKNVTINCYGNGYPKPTVQWMLNNTLIPILKSVSEVETKSVVQVITGISSPLQNVTARLFLRTAGVTYNEAGNYTCLANNTIKGNVSLSTQNLEILFKPQFTEQPSNVTVLSGNNASFSCKTTGYPKPTIGWSFNGGELPQHKVSDDGTLTVLFADNSVEYEGGYTCTASSRAGIKLTTAWLTVDVPPKILSTTANYSLLISEKLELKCEATGDPQPSVFWMKDGVQKSNSSMLTIENVDFDDTGRYQCVANSRAGNATASVWVVIQAHAQVYINEPFTRSFVRHQENVTVSCYGNGYPEPTVQWMLNNTLIPILKSFSDNDTNRVVQVITGTSSPLQNVTARLFLRTAGVTYNEAGNYTCLANNTIKGNVSLSKQNVEILFKPEFVTMPKSAIRSERHSVRFNCSAIGIPSPRLSWSFSNGKLPQHKLLGNDLVIESVQNNRSYEGVFTCTASSRAGTVKTSAELIVQVPPSMEQSLESLVAERWSTVSFTCLASGDPSPTYKWKFYDHERKSSRIELQDQNRTLVLHNVTEKDDGIYTCIASNVAGQIEQSANLTVHARPRLIAKLGTNITVVAGKTINFTCVGEGIPTPEITWLRNSKLLVSEDRYAINTTGDTERRSVLTIYSVEYQDHSEYTCVATNNRGSANSTTYLTVYVSTSITEVSEPVAQEIKKPVTLKCFARGYLLPSMKWKKADVDITNNSRVVISTKSNATSLLVQSVLNINEVERSDTDNYTCIASNNINEAQSTAKITVLERPDKLQVHLVKKTAREISISWTLTFDGNLPILWFSVSHNVSQFRNLYNISSDMQQANLTDLKPFTLYNVHVTATNRVGESEPAVLLVTTREWRPESPRNVSATVINSTSFQVTWIHPLIANGIIESYVVYYWPSHGNVSLENNITVLAPRTSAVVTDLMPHTNYSCLVQAFTSVGGGNLSLPVVTAQTQEDAPSAPWDLKVNKLDASSITIQWRRPQTLNGVLRGYTVSLSNKDGSFPNRNMTAGYLIDPVVFKVDKLEPFTRYRIMVRAFTVKYSVYSENINQATRESAPSEPTDVSKTQTKKEVTVKWKVPNKPNGIIIGYNVYFEVTQHVGEDQPQNKVFTTENNVTEKIIPLDELNGATVYRIKVSGKTNAGEGKKSLDEEKLEMQPTKPPEPQTPSSPNQTDSTAVLEIPKFSDVNGNIKYYKIYVTVYPTADYEGSSQNVEIVSWNSVYNKVDQFNRPYAYLAFQFHGDKYKQYRVFTVGDEDAYSKNRKRRQAEPEYKNLKLRANRKYEVFVRGYVTDSLYTESKPAAIKTKPPPNSKPPENGSSAITVAVVVVLIVVLVAVFIVGIYVRRRRQKSRNAGRDESIHLESMPGGDSEDIYDQPVCVEQKIPIPVESLKQHFLRMHANDDLLFKEEYKSIQTPGNPTTEFCDAGGNRAKNRYLNIKAYDHSRVILSKKPGTDNSDYINANYIDGYKCKKRYIATIGPKQETEDDFWRMVFEQGSYIIVMLTRCVENGKVKCHQYWPDEGHEDYSGINVVLMDTEELADYEIRTFKVHTPSQPSKAPRTVTHFFFTAWPDHDVPDHATSLLEFWRRVKSTMPKSNGPIIVHCSAGVGRTGTFIVIDAMMDQIEAEREMDVYNFVTHIRGQRNFMVQRESQYTFIHYAILEAVTFGKTEITVQDLRVTLRQLNKKGRSNEESEMQRQFRLLDGAVPDENSDFTTALLPENRSKNRYTNIFPFDRTRVQLVLVQNTEGQDTTYINASFIGGYQLKTAFIATQAPLKNTVVDFWRMVWEQGVYSIVMLVQEEELLKVPLTQYWPQKGAFLSGSINVELAEQTSNKGFIERQISLTNTEVGEVRRVRHFHYTEWPANGCPANPSTVIDLIGCVQKRQMQTGNKPIIVHCSDGIGRTGAFCCISTCLERVKTEGIIDVFNAARILRTQRPGMINKMEQYRFCYDALVAYLDSFEEYQYQNFQ